MRHYLKIVVKGIIGTLIALALLGLCEITLRQTDIAKPIDLFIPYAENPNYLVFNPEISKSIFYKNDESFLPQLDLFKKRKPDNVYRIFTLGGSTTYGFPYSHNTSFPRILERALQGNLNKEVEVINLSLTAINSYTLKSWAAELHKFEPDLVVVYTGHNEHYEYYGVHGVSSSYHIFSSILLNDLYFAVKNLRLFNLLKNIIEQPSANLTKKTEVGLMQKLAEDQLIPLNGPVFSAGMEQFESNLTSIKQTFAQENIDVIFGTLVSNISDQMPLDYLSSKDSTQSSYHLYQNGKSQHSADLLMEAKEQDQLRFRAPNKFNSIIKKFN